MAHIKFNKRGYFSLTITGKSDMYPEQLEILSKYSGSGETTRFIMDLIAERAELDALAVQRIDALISRFGQAE